MDFEPQGGKLLDPLLREHMEILIEEINSRIDDVKSVLLTAGFGRGEGSWKLVDGQRVPLNDYDVYVITGKPVGESVLNEVSKTATARMRLPVAETFSFYQSSHTMLDRFYVDLRNTTLKQLPRLPPLLKFYEIKEAAEPLYGEDVRALIPPWKLTEIPRFEGFRFLLNRMSNMAEYFLPEYCWRELDQAESETVLYFSAKAALSIAEALTLLNGSFVASYRLRARYLEERYREDFSELAAILPDLPTLVRRMTDFKLAPKFDDWRGHEVELWFEVRDACGAVVRYFARAAFDVHLWEDWARAGGQLVSDMPLDYLSPYVRPTLRRAGLNGNLISLSAGILAVWYLNLVYVQRLWQYRRRLAPWLILQHPGPDLRLYAALLPLLFAPEPEGGVSGRLLKAAHRNLGHVSPMVSMNGGGVMSWRQIRQLYGDAYRLYAHSKVV